MLYVQLDANWPDHHKIIAAGLDGAGLHAVVLCLAKRHETDGWLHRPLLHRHGASDDLIDRLIGLELLEAEGQRVRPWDWLDRNPSQAAIDAKRASKSEAGRRGNHDRWSHPGPFESCPKCQVVAGCDPTGSLPDPTRSPESESEVGSRIAGAIPPVPPDQESAVDFTRHPRPRLDHHKQAEGKASVTALRQHLHPEPQGAA